MEKRFAGVYRCSYQNGSRWSLPSSQLELVATGNWKRGGWVCWDVRPLGYVVLSSGLQEGDDGDDDDGVFTKPSLSAQPSAAVSPGMDVTLRCESQYGFDRFALYKEGDTGPYKRPEQWYLADFPITTVTAANSGTYRCYSFSSSSPYLWSAPSDPLELVVKESSEAPGRLSPSLVNQGSTAGPPVWDGRNLVDAKGSSLTSCSLWAVWHPNRIIILSPLSNLLYHGFQIGL
ncbi:platelet glycoprotein VI-like protein [Camelus ferus]|nr:platelet glycoprotein VI-like protein [Camelus ferus]